MHQRDDEIVLAGRKIHDLGIRSGEDETKAWGQEVSQVAGWAPM